MIFVTVGTHEQPMNRLFEALEKVPAGLGSIYIQSGPTQFKFSRCQAKEFYEFDEIQDLMRQADLIITHGGPATIVQARMAGKIPLVVPRQHRFGEHVNDHQVLFCRRLEKEKLIYCATEVGDLTQIIQEYSERTRDLPLPQKQGSASIKELCRNLTEYCENHVSSR